MLVVAGCSSDSDGKSEAKPESSASTAATGTAPEATPSEKPVEPAKYTKLPEPCKAISAKTIEELVPDVKDKAGTPGKSSDVTSRGSCSWNGLEDKGVDGSQYRWLDISVLRYDSEQSLGSGEKRAQDSYAKEVAKVKASEGATQVKTSPAKGVGQDATAIAYGLKKTGEDFRYAAIVTRAENTVITVSFNGAGYAGADTPASSELMEGTVKATKEAVAAVAAANK